MPSISFFTIKVLSEKQTGALQTQTAVLHRAIKVFGFAQIVAKKPNKPNLISLATLRPSYHKSAEEVLQSMKKTWDHYYLLNIM